MVLPFKSSELEDAQPTLLVDKKNLRLTLQVGTRYERQRLAPPIFQSNGSRSTQAQMSPRRSGT
jgi:hypothetical protein